MIEGADFKAMFGNRVMDGPMQIDGARLEQIAKGVDTPPGTQPGTQPGGMENNGPAAMIMTLLSTMLQLMMSLMGGMAGGQSNLDKQPVPYRL